MATDATRQAEKRERVKRYLSRYRATVSVYDSLLKIIESAESRLASITAQQSEVYTPSSAHDALADQIITLNDYIDKLSACILRETAALDGMLYVIERTMDTDCEVAEILSKRYLEPGYEPTFQEIADEMGISEKTVRRKHVYGLDLVWDELSKKM